MGGLKLDGLGREGMELAYSRPFRNFLLNKRKDSGGRVFGWPEVKLLLLSCTGCSHHQHVLFKHHGVPLGLYPFWEPYFLN